MSRLQTLSQPLKAAPDYATSGLLIAGLRLDVIAIDKLERWDVPAGAEKPSVDLGTNLAARVRAALDRLEHADAEVARLRAIVDRYEADRLASLGADGGRSR